MKRRIDKHINYDKSKWFLKIPSTSEEYQKARYLMELHLGTFEIETFKIWKIENKALSSLYQDYSDQDTVTFVNSVILTNSLGENNRPNKVAERGFLVP